MLEKLREFLKRTSVPPKENQEPSVTSINNTLSTETDSIAKSYLYEGISTPGEPRLVLCASSEDLTPMIEKMKNNLKRREEKSNTTIEEPVIKRIPSDKKGVLKLDVDYDGQHYSFEGKGTEKEFKDWFCEYLKKAPKCITCDQIIFPGSAVGECNKGVMHDGPDCCPSGGFFVGHIDKEGKIIPAFPDLK